MHKTVMFLDLNIKNKKLSSTEFLVSVMTEIAAVFRSLFCVLIQRTDDLMKCFRFFFQGLDAVIWHKF